MAQLDRVSIVIDFVGGSCSRVRLAKFSKSQNTVNLKGYSSRGLKKLIKKIAKKVTKLIKKAAGAVVDVAKFIADTLAKIGTTLSQLISDVLSIIEAALGKVLPDQIFKVVSMIISIIDFGAQASSMFLQNLAEVIKTGNLLYLLDFVSPTVAALVEEMRRYARGTSKPVPQIVLDQIVDDKWRGFVAENVRFNYLKNVEASVFWRVWGEFKGHRSAICFIDTIVFVDESDFRRPEDIFEFLHELKHVEQYRSMGVVGFVREYLLEQMFSGGLNKFEKDADIYACGLYPHAEPAYIGTCP